MIRKTPLESWIARRIGLPQGEPLSYDHLAAYQLERVRQVLVYVLEHSGFYQRHLAGFRPDKLFSLGDLRQMPFTTADDIAAAGLQLLCVSQDEIARVVTLPTSGTTGQPKRLYFTSDDIELSLDFFHYGMSSLVQPGQRVLILLPGRRPDSAGDLLARALKRMQVSGFVYGPVDDPGKVVDEVLRMNIDCLVGIPGQILSLVRDCRGAGIKHGMIKSVLLTTDYVPQVLSRAVEEAWDCRVFAHYGMTEMGLGGGVECGAFAGYHMREADLHFEIIDPQTGFALPNGEWGEVVFTTLTREGMPLIRYRTGDISRFLPDSCPCGTMLKLMDRRCYRRLGMRPLGRDSRISINDLDEALFDVPQIVDYRAALTDKRPKDVLRLDLFVTPWSAQELRSTVGSALLQVAAIHDAIKSGLLDVEISCTEENRSHSTGGGKRTLVDLRKREG